MGEGRGGAFEVSAIYQILGEIKNITQQIIDDKQTLNNHKYKCWYLALILLMYLLEFKFRSLEFLLLLSWVTPYLQFVTMNCLILNMGNFRPLVKRSSP